MSIYALLALNITPAYADTGTAAGTEIQNSVSVTFDVGGVAQNPVSSNTDAFLVDRKVNVTVAEVGSAATIVTPGAISQVTTFSVTNLSNDTADFALSVSQQNGGTAAFGGNDTFDATNVKIYLETDSVAGFSAGDTEVTSAAYIDELAADTSKTVYVVSSIPLGLTTNAIATVTLTADGHAGGTASSLGAELTTSSTNTANAVDTVLADAAGATDGQYDGSFSAKDDYKVTAAAIGAVKSSRVVNDYITTSGDMKAIPGALVEYCILVSNNGSAPATSVSITDNVPASVTRDATFGVKLQATCSDTSNPGAGSFADPGTFGKGVASGNLGTLAAGASRALVFRATID
ncbi:MAG: hypothetical protein ACKOPO_00170 [Novosphingobium sp.]